MDSDDCDDGDDSDAFSDAGFSDVTTWWEGFDKHGDGTGVFKPNRKGEPCEGFVAYLTAKK